MPRDGSGVYTLPTGNPVVDGTAIEAAWANDTMADLANEITNSLPRSGVAPMSGNLAMGNNKITGLATGTATTDAVTKSQVDAVTTAYIAADAAHVAAADPHPGYLTSAEGNAAYQPLDAELTALAGLTSAANKVPRFTGSETAEVIDLVYGTYTPTFSNFSNIASITNKYSTYLRVGNVIFVTIKATVSTSIGAAYSFNASIPITTATTNSLTGVADGGAIQQSHGTVAGPLSGGAYVWMTASTDGSPHDLCATFSYTV